MGLEDEIIQKFKDKKLGEQTGEDMVHFNKHGLYREIAQKLEIMNLDDFPQDIREIICDIIKKPMNTGKEFLFKEAVCVITKQGIVFEGILDNEDKMYVFKNIQIQISGITSIRIKTDVIEVDSGMFDVANETLLCNIKDEKISCMLFETGNDFFSTVDEATQLGKKNLKTFYTCKIYGKNKKVRFNPETGRLYIR